MSCELLPGSVADGAQRPMCALRALEGFERIIDSVSAGELFQQFTAQIIEPKGLTYVMRAAAFG